MQLRVLSEAEVERIHDATLSVLAKTGAWFRDCPEALALFEEAGCTVGEDGRVLMPREVVTDALSGVADRSAFRPFVGGLGYAEPLDVDRGVTHFGLIGNAYYIYDYEKREARDCMESDVADKLLVLDSLKNFEFDCCNLFTASDRGISKSDRASYESLGDCISFLERWVLARAVPAHKKLPLGNRNCCREESRLTVLGHAIIEGVEATEVLLKGGNGFPWVNPQSPLQYKAGEARAMIEAARDDSGRSFNHVSPEVMMGGTGPVTMAGALVQHNAEVLAGLVLTQLARPGSPYVYGCVSAPMDLRNAEISHGNYETALFNAAVVQIADSYGLPTRISPGNTSDRKPSARALAETAIGLYMGAAAGGNLITTGLLDSTLMISYEHMVMVDELVDQIRSITKPIDTGVDSLALDAIGEHGRPGSDYLAAGHTMQFMKRDVHYSAFTGRLPESYEDSYEKAHGRVKEILARRHASDHVEEQVLQRLHEVEKRMTEDDSTWRRGQGEWWTTYVGQMQKKGA